MFQQNSSSGVTAQKGPNMAQIWTFSDFCYKVFYQISRCHALRASKVTANFCPKKIRAKIDDNILSQSAAVIFSMQS